MGLIQGAYLRQALATHLVPRIIVLELMILAVRKAVLKAAPSYARKIMTSGLSGMGRLSPKKVTNISKMTIGKLTRLI